MPDVGTLVGETQWGPDQHIWLAMQPTRPCLSDAVRILDGIGDPAGAKFDGRKARRTAITPDVSRAMGSIMGKDGLFYASTVGAFG